MTSVNMREDPLFMRNSFLSVGRWDIPLVKKQTIDLTNVRVIACSDTKANDNDVNKRNGVHFFVDDYRFTGIYDHPEKTLSNYSQY